MKYLVHEFRVILVTLDDPSTNFKHKRQHCLYWCCNNQSLGQRILVWTS